MKLKTLDNTLLNVKGCVVNKPRNVDAYSLVVVLIVEQAKVEARELGNTLGGLLTESLEHTMGGALWQVEGQRRVVDTHNDTDRSGRVEPEALNYTLTGTVAKETADTIGEKFRDVESEA